MLESPGVCEGELVLDLLLTLLFLSTEDFCSLLLLFGTDCLTSFVTVDPIDPLTFEEFKATSIGFFSLLGLGRMSGKSLVFFTEEAEGVAFSMAGHAFDSLCPFIVVLEGTLSLFVFSLTSVFAFLLIFSVIIMTSGLSTPTSFFFFETGVLITVSSSSSLTFFFLFFDT